MFGLSSRAGAAPVERRDAVDQAVQTALAALRGSSVVAGSGSVRSLPAVNRGLQLIAGTASMMPLDVMRKQGDESVPVRAVPDLLREPSAEVPLEDWVWQHLDAMIVHGDAFGRIVRRDESMRPLQVELVDPACVTVRSLDAGRSISAKFGDEPVAWDDVWHVAGRPRSAGPFGRGLLDVARDILSTGLASREWARAWFVDGGSPSVVVKQNAPAPDGVNLDNADRAKALKEKIKTAIRGNRDPLVMPGWIDLERWPAPTPTEAALVDVLRQNSTDIAHHMGVPPELVGGVTGDSMTYANIEARMIDLLVFGVDYWLTKLERKFTRAIPGNQYAKFNRAAVLRADQKAVADTLSLLVRSGLITQNEARDKLDRQRLDGADVLLWPPNATTDPTPTDPTPPSQGAGR